LDPGLRTALLAVGVVFCGAFAAATVSVVADTGFDILTAIALLIVAMIATGLIGAIRNPPDE
jgi:NhaP-type Na+/H+ and K+/H+ antiporter